MSENHSTNNLIKKACFYFQHDILTSWNKCIKALKSSESILQQAADLALVNACAESLIIKALNDPDLLGEPVRNVTTTDDDSENGENPCKPNVSRRLFVLDWKSEDLTVLSIALYEPIIRAMIHRNIPLEYVASSLFHYLNKWVFPATRGEDDPSIYERNSLRKIIEAVERLLPQEKGLIPCSWLSQMLQSAIFLDANTECKTSLEVRIGKQLARATVKDLLIPSSQGYAKEDQYDSECLRRIMKNHYSNYTGTDISGLIAVAELIDEFLAEVASDIDLKLNTFISLAELSQAASEGTHRNSDGMYRAIDIYLDTHRHLTDWEREEVCRLLDCNKMSPEACEHAGQNEKLPVRVMVQILFSVQLKSLVA